MPTLTENVETAIAGLNAATLEMRAARIAFDTVSRDTVQKTTDLVATVTPLVIRWWVDPVNGNDAADGKSAAKARKTIEAVTAVAPPNTRHEILLLGDTTVSTCGPVSATVTLVGAQVAANAEGFIRARRRVDFRPEATNSPLIDGARRSAGFLINGIMATIGIDVVLPDAPDGVTGFLFQGGNGSSVVMTGGSIQGTTASNAARVFVSSDASALSVWFTGTIGAGAQGRLFSGIAAGADPNVGKRFISNLTTN